MHQHLPELLHLRFDLGIEHSAGLALGWFPARLIEIRDDVVRSSRPVCLPSRLTS